MIENNKKKVQYQQVCDAPEVSGFHDGRNGEDKNCAQGLAAGAANRRSKHPKGLSLFYLLLCLSNLRCSQDDVNQEQFVYIQI